MSLRQDLIKLAKEKPELRKMVVGLLRRASRDGYYILSALVPDKDLLELHTRLDKDGPDGDRQSADLLMDIRAKLAKELEPSRGGSEALSRLLAVATRGKNWDVALIRNNIFKAANSLGMRLPSHMFASETRKAGVHPHDPKEMYKTLFAGANALYDGRADLRLAEHMLQDVFSDPTGQSGEGYYNDPEIRKLRDSMNQLDRSIGEVARDMEHIARKRFKV